MFLLLCTTDISDMIVLCVAEREEGRLKGDVKRLNQEKEVLKERRNAYEVSGIRQDNKNAFSCSVTYCHMFTLLE